MKNRTYESLYNSMRNDEVLLRSRKYALWTLPQLIANDYQNGGTILKGENIQRDYQEIGALLVNNLSSKLAGVLFPVNRPFFNTSVDSSTLDQAEKYFSIDKNKLSSVLTKLEINSCKKIFDNDSYNQLILALKHLICFGNVLINREDNKTVCYGINQFTCRRDNKGNLLDCILKEITYFDGLPFDIQQKLITHYPSRFKLNDDSVNQKQVSIYTRIKRYLTENGSVMYEVSQECEKIKVGETGEYPELLCPFIAPMWTYIAGENYGRGLIEDYSGAFARLSELSLSGLLYDVNMMKVLNIVTGSVINDIDSIATMETGEYVQGDPNSITAYEVGSAQKSNQIQMKIEGIFQNLAKAFAYSANTRDAERVTAFELRQQADEANQLFGGVYSSLSSSLQLPLSYLLMIEEDPLIQVGLVTKELKLSIKTGVSALERSNEVSSLLNAAQEGAGVMTLVQLDKRIDGNKIMDAIYAGSSVIFDDYKKSDEQLEKEQQAIEANTNAQNNLLQGDQLLSQQQALQQLNSQ